MKGSLGLAKKPLENGKTANKIADEIAIANDKGSNNDSNKNTGMFAFASTITNTVTSTVTSAFTATSTFTRLYFLIQDDMLVVKEKASNLQVMHKFYFSKMNDFGVVPRHNCMFFTYGKDVFVLKTDLETDLLNWTKTLIFMKEESLKLEQPLVFDKFEIAVSTRDQFFLRDEPNYNYDSIKFKQKQQSQTTKAFDTSAMNVDDGGEGKTVRSVEELSACSDDSSAGLIEDDGKGTTAQTKKEVIGEEKPIEEVISEEFDKTWNSVKDWWSKF